MLAVVSSKAKIGTERELKLKTSAPNIVEIDGSLTLAKVGSENKEATVSTDFNTSKIMQFLISMWLMNPHIFNIRLVNFTLLLAMKDIREEFLYALTVDKRQWHHWIPAFCRQREHQRSSSSHHRRCPMSHCSGSPLYPPPYHSQFHSPPASRGSGMWNWKLHVCVYVCVCVWWGWVDGCECSTVQLRFLLDKNFSHQSSS